MKHLYKPFLVVFLLPLFSLAQSNYKPGIVITLKGDTLHGFIDYKEWENNPKDITFKNKLDNSNTESFSTKNTAAFSITGLEYYQRFVLSISNDEVEIGKLALKPDTGTIADTIFLKVITKGKYLTLYRYTDDIKQRFFFSEAGESQPQELIYHAYYNADESSSVQYINRYRNQLVYLTQKYAVNNDKLNGQILGANYNEPELTKVVQIINGISSQQFTTQKLAGSRWFAGIGANYSNLKFTETGGTPSAGTNVSNSSSILPEITAGINFFPNESVQSLLFRAELSVAVNQYKISNADNSGTPPSTSSVNFTQYNSSITPQIIFNIYNKEQLKAFIGVGAAFNFSAYNQYRYITNYGGSIPDYIQNNYPAFDKFWLSFPIKAGITLNNKIEINICYIPSASLTNDNIDSGNVTSYQLGVNYLFGK